jgi:hypothetical protein
MADATREVVVSIKTVPDKGNAGTFRSLANQIQALGKPVSISASGSSIKAIETSLKKVDADAKRSKAEADKILKQVEADAKKARKEQEKADADAQKRLDKLVKDREAAAAKDLKAIKDREKAQANLARAVETASTRQREAQARLSDASKGVLEGFAQLGRGAAMLGIAGEEDTKKLLEGLIKIQAGFDLLKGSITIVQKMGEAMRAYKVATAGAAAAQAALSAAQKGGAGAALAGGVGGKLAAGAAGGIGAGATAGLAVAALASVAVAGKMVVETFKDIGKYGLGGGSSPGTLTGWAGEKIAQGAAGLYNATGGSGGALGRMAGGLQAVPGIGLGLQGLQSYADAGANLAASNKETERRQKEAADQQQVLERQRQQIAIQAERDAAIGELNRGIGERERMARFRAQGGREEMAFGTRAAEAEAARGGAVSAADRVKELQRQGRGGAELADAMADAGKAAAQLAESEKRRSGEERNLRLNQGLSAEGVQAARMERAAAAERVSGLETGLKAASGRGDTGDAARIQAELEVARKQQADAIQREADATGKRLQTERQISQEKLAAVNASIQGAEQEIALRKQAIQTERERLQGAKERFGAMDPLEQQRVAGLLQQARAGQTLSEEDLQTLQGLGLRETDRIAGEQRRKKAEQGGWTGLNLGMEEKQRIAEEKQAVGALEVKLKDQRELKVNIARDDRKLASDLAEQIAKMLNERDKLLTGLVEEISRQKQAAANQQAQTRATGQ